MVAPSSTGAVPSCLEPWQGSGSQSAEFDPQPLDEADLQKAEAASASGPDRAYARARRLFQARHWAEAARGLREVALEHSDAEVGIYAAQLYIEALNILGTHAGRPDCFDDMGRDIGRFRELYCQAHRHEHEEQCGILDNIQLARERLEAERLVEQSERHPNDLSGYRAGAESYLALLKEHCPTGAFAEHCDELAYNAASALIAAHDVPAAEGVLRLMRDPKNGISKSALTKLLLCKLDGSAPECK